MRDGDFPNVGLAFKDFAFQYGLYSANFTHYVSAVINNLSDPKHKKILQCNLAEEHGDTHDVELPQDVLASVEGQPHTVLYRRFQEAIGVDLGNLEATSECPGLIWSQQFLALCDSNECTGAGAIGIGTEFIVSRIFGQILDGLKVHSNLTMEQRVFFDLHSDCDEKHAADVLTITEDLAQDRASCADIEHGARMAIHMRKEFWDNMLRRARDFPATESHAAKAVSAVGHRKNLQR